MSMTRLVGAAAPDYKHATVTQALAAAATSKAKVTFLDLREQATPVTFAEVYDRAKRAAAALASEGVVPGDRVVISAATTLEFLDAFFGTMFAGAIPVPMAPAARTQDLATYASRASRLIESLQPRLFALDAPSLTSLQRSGFDAQSRLLPIEGLAGRSEETLVVEAGADDIALLQLSSGSVGDPKAVTILHRHVTQHCAILAGGMPGVTTAVSWLPLYHDMGLTGFLMKSICDQHDLVLFKPDYFIMRPAIWLRAVSRYRGEFCSVPNFAYAMCLSRITDEEMEGADLSAYRHSLNGAEPIHAGLFRKFGKRFSKWGLNPAVLRPTYGLAEATLAVTISPEGAGIRSTFVDPEHLARTNEAIEGKREVCSVGKPYPGVAVEIRDPEGKALPERSVGAIWINSPTNMQGYYRNEAASKRVLVDGWLDSGDVGFTLDGELYIVARAKDVVVIRGGNHAPEEFEDCLLGMEGLRPGAAAAVGMTPEDAAGEELFLFVEPMPGTNHEELTRSIRSAVLEHTGIRPHTIVFARRGSLPRTTSGKLRRRETLRLYQAGELPLARSKDES